MVPFGEVPGPEILGRALPWIVGPGTAVELFLVAVAIARARRLRTSDARARRAALLPLAAYLYLVTSTMFMLVTLYLSQLGRISVAWFIVGAAANVIGCIFVLVVVVRRA